MPSVSRDADAPTCWPPRSGWPASSASPAAGSSRPAGHPVVRGEWLGAAGAPTVLVYGHYDVQPTGDASRVAHSPVPS